MGQLDLEAIIEREVSDKSLVMPDEKKSDDIKSRSASGLYVEGDSSNGEVVEYLHHDETEGKIHIEQVQDTEPVLEDAKKRHLAGFHGSSEWKHAGRFPTVIVNAWLNQRGISMREFKGQVVKDFLNDSNHSAFRIWPGRV